MSLANHIAKTARCTICDSPGVGSCRCWILLRCPRCNREQSTERIPEDPPEDVYELRCPNCADREGDVEADDPRTDSAPTIEKARVSDGDLDPSKTPSISENTPKNADNPMELRSETPKGKP